NNENTHIEQNSISPRQSLRNRSEQEEYNPFLKLAVMIQKEQQARKLAALCFFYTCTSFLPKNVRSAL
ncbi:hypothetical protein SB767_35425, partial [Bacillus sp. SIMBA_069]